MEDDENSHSVLDDGEDHADGTPSPPANDDSDEDTNPLSRRTVLGGLASIGTIGAVSGAGAQAILYDEEVFGNAGGGSEVNVVQSGELDLKTCWEDDTEECEPVNDPEPFDFGEIEVGDSGSAILRCQIDDNPGWMWFRTSCPEDPCGIEDVLKITMRFDSHCDSETESQIVVTDDGIEIEELPLCEALAALRSGVLLGDEPHSPDETCCLEIEWEVDGQICGEEELDQDITFEFYTEQSRHTDGPPDNPWPDADCDVDCDTDCPPCDEDGQGISHVAFCTEEGPIETGDISFTPFYAGDDTEPFRLEWVWTGEVELCTIALFYGNIYENFYVGDTGDPKGTVTVGEGDERYCRIPGNSNNDCSDTDVVGTTDETGQKPDDPCPNDCGCGVKFDFTDDGGYWSEVCWTDDD